MSIHIHKVKGDEKNRGKVEDEGSTEKNGSEEEKTRNGESFSCVYFQSIKIKA